MKKIKIVQNPLALLLIVFHVSKCYIPHCLHFHPPPRSSEWLSTSLPTTAKRINQVATGFSQSLQWFLLALQSLLEFTRGLKSTEMAEIVVAEATGKCPEIETQTY